MQLSDVRDVELESLAQVVLKQMTPDTVTPVILNSVRTKLLKPHPDQSRPDAGSGDAQGRFHGAAAGRPGVTP